MAITTFFFFFFFWEKTRVISIVEVIDLRDWIILEMMDNIFYHRDQSFSVSFS